MDIFMAVLGFVTGLVIYQLFLRKHVLRRLGRHEHIWKCISARNHNTFPSNDAKYPSRRYTRLLHQCFCGELRVSEVEGHWEKNIVLEKPITF